MRLCVSLISAVLASFSWFVLVGIWIANSAFAAGFALDTLSPDEADVAWASGYRIQAFIIGVLPPLVAATAALVQRRVAPRSWPLWAMIAALPATFVLLLTNLLVFYGWSAILLVPWGFTGVWAGLAFAQRRKTPHSGEQL